MRRLFYALLAISLTVSTAVAQVQVTQEEVVVQSPITFMPVTALLIRILATENDVHISRAWLNGRETEPCVYLPIRFGETPTFASQAEVIRKRGLIHRLAELNSTGLTYRNEHVLQLGDEVVVQHYSEHCGASILKLHVTINNQITEFDFDPANFQ